ncbi:MAG: hypothetical protein K1X29_05090 [Bdellovibrionales bacterium]|nr:hypothetical protein [Bdellovibrionales bacterium]
MTTLFVLVCGIGASLSEPSFATIKLIGVNGASNDNFANIGNTNPKIFGSVVGNSSNGTDCVVTGSSTCDGCETASGFFLCNRRRISSSLSLQISFQSDNIDGYPALALNDSSNTMVASSSISVGKGNTATLAVSWSTLCSNISGSDSNCSAAGTLSNNFKLGITKVAGQFSSGDDVLSSPLTITVSNPENSAGEYDSIEDCTTNTNGDNKPGVCSFIAYPGDEKVFIQMDTNSVGSGFPILSNSTIKSLRFYFSTSGFVTKPSDGDMADIPIEVSDGSDSFTIVDPIIDGLTNGENYYFRVGSVDEAGNEMYFTSNSAINNICGSMSPTRPFDGSAGNDACTLAASPDAVVGLLSKDLNCFIATAAYDSPFHPLVTDLRTFRNHFLLPFKMGRKFINWYYSWSPKAAWWLKKHPQWKPMIQSLLVPIWISSLAVLNWPITLLMVLLGIVVLQIRVKFWKNV